VICDVLHSFGLVSSLSVVMASCHHVLCVCMVIVGPYLPLFSLYIFSFVFVHLVKLRGCMFAALLFVGLVCHARESECVTWSYVCMN
jgi:hypothetical protein